MLILSKKHKGVDVIDCWYAGQRPDRKGIIRYREALMPVGDRPREFHTLVSDLTKTEDEILADFSKNCRYEVRRAQREGITNEFYLGGGITETQIAEFGDYFQAFWKSKGTDYSDQEKEKCREQIRQYAQADAFAITAAKADGEILVFHTYIVDEAYARLYQSASWFRVDERVSASTVGYANRALHYADMLWFKGMGKTRYDWGGAGTEKEVESIARFKESFGGTPRVYYDGEETVGISAGLYRKLTGFIGALTEKRPGKGD